MNKDIPLFVVKNNCLLAAQNIEAAEYEHDDYDFLKTVVKPVFIFTEHTIMFSKRINQWEKIGDFPG